MKIPLTQDNRRRTFNPTDLADLQAEFGRKLHQRFRQERREVVAALDERTRIVVRGCNFGQSQEALNALRAFFGGSPYVFAPRGYQGFEVLPIGRSILRTPEEAFDFLVEQGYLPADQKQLSVKEKQKYIHNVFGSGIPAEFFIMSEEDANRLKKLPLKQKLGAEAEGLIIRPSEHGIEYPTLPSAGEFWGVSHPSLLGRDPELDVLSIDEIVERARQLNNPYRPQNAAMLLRLRSAWWRKLKPPLVVLSDDPLAGYPRIFGDGNILAGDAARYPNPAPIYDVFESETLPRPAITPEKLAQARQFDDVIQAVEPIAASGMPEVSESNYPSGGQVETLADRIRLWNFPVSSARLRSAFRAPLRQIAEQAIANPNLSIRIEGHTSSSSADITNERLSQERAQSVAQFLMAAGVPATRMTIQGFGERNLIARERRRNGQLIPEGMARNRRVDIHLTTQASPSTPLPTETDLEEIIRRFGPPPAHRPEWIMWVFRVLSGAGKAQTVAGVLGRLRGVDIRGALDVASFVRIGAWVIFAPLASYAEGQALGYANGAKRGFATAITYMAGSVNDPPTGEIVYPSDEVPLDIQAWPYSEGAQDGYQHGVQAAIQLIRDLQNQTPHGGEIFLLALRHLYPGRLYTSIINLLGGYQRRFRTPTPVDPLLRLMGEEVPEE